MKATLRTKHKMYLIDTHARWATEVRYKDYVQWLYSDPEFGKSDSIL